MKIAENFELSPIDYANQGNSLVGIRGSGKTYTAMKLAEQLMLNNIPIIAFDPTGIWQNLRYGVDDKKGFPIVVAGGLHADIELTAENCTKIIEAALKENISLIIDLQGRATSTKTKWLHIVSECVDYLMQHNLGHGLRHIFIEEAAEFVPQRPNPGGAMAYSKLESMARMGRNYGLGYTLINQRPEEIAKAIFEISEMVLVHRQSGKNSLKSMRDWLNYKDLSDAKIVESLPRLENGQCWAIDNRGETLINILPKDTFHPDPKRGNNIAPLKAIADVSDFIQRMRDLINLPAKEDGKISSKDHKRLAELELEIKTLKARNNDLEVENFDLKENNQQLVNKLAKIATIAGQAGETISLGKTDIQIIMPEKSATAKVSAPIPADRSTVNINTKSGSGLIRMLKAAAMFHPLTITKQRMATLSGINANGGTFGNYMRSLLNDGLLNKITPTDFVATEKGMLQVGEIEPLPDDPKFLIEMWCGIIGTDNGASRMLRILGDRYPEALSKPAIGELAGINSAGGTFGNYLRLLKSNNLIMVNGNQVKAADELFN